MPILLPQQAQRLREMFDAQAHDRVRITLFTRKASPDDVNGAIAQSCRDAHDLLTEVAALAPNYLVLEERDLAQDAAEAEALGINRVPAILLRGKAAGVVRTFGVPSDYEFTTLIDDLFDLTSGGRTTLGANTRAMLALITRPVHLQVFVAPT